ncbi:MAG TPA: gluconate:H+ symporter [Chthoniobacteraceae bacterium]|jgi:GntP family gluconate:H+ symporter|nr:gluconate:H+ symporter [Chthoniobacteraceae bacterium]
MLEFLHSPNGLLVLTVAVIALLIVLITRFKVPAFIAILIAALVMGIGSGMPLATVADTFNTGLGNTLKTLGMIIGLGTVLGKLLAESGAAEVIATTAVRKMGVARLDYAVMLVAFLVGISVFFGVGIVLLGPIAFTLARETRTPILRLALPMAAGLSVAHGLIPPHPGPMAAIGLLKADVGKTILWSVLFGLPTALVTGPLLARWVTPRVPVEIGGLGAQATAAPQAPRRPGFGISVFTMLLPVILMLIATLVDTLGVAPTTPLSQIAHFLGAPAVAMLIAVLTAFVTFGSSCGLKKGQILKFSEESVAPAAALFLVIGAGGGFSAVLNESGVGKAMAGLAGHEAMSPAMLLFVGWGIAGLLRIAVGSATVAIQAAATLMLPLINLPGAHVNKELLVLSMGAGSLILSHVNDSGFWFVREYLGMSVEQTLKTWTIVETGIAITSFALILVANLFLT